MMRLVDAAAQASHLVYEYTNTVATGLVDQPEHMPMPMLGFDVWKVGYIEVVDAVRQAFVNEAEEIVEEATLDLAEPTPHRSARDKAGKNGGKKDNTASGSDGAGEPDDDERDPPWSAIASTSDASRRRVASSPYATAGEEGRRAARAVTAPTHLLEPRAPRRGGVRRWTRTGGASVRLQ